jgi:hypothetical protein
VWDGAHQDRDDTFITRSGGRNQGPDNLETQPEARPRRHELGMSDEARVAALLAEPDDEKGEVGVKEGVGLRASPGFRRLLSSSELCRLDAVDRRVS